MNENTKSIGSSIRTIRDELRHFERKYDRDNQSVELLAVSKRKPVSAIIEAHEAGQMAFGENYVDEAIEKMDELQYLPLEWHFIGAIQSRKTALIARHFDWVHSIDRIKVARRLSDQRPAELPPLNICLQVNLDKEQQKAGVDVEQISELAAQVAELPRIKLSGLMVIPLPRTDFEQQRQVFRLLREQRDDLVQIFPEMTMLSMGMSSDLEAAIAEGSTLVRIGTAIFGARDS